MSDRCPRAALRLDLRRTAGCERARQARWGRVRLAGRIFDATGSYAVAFTLAATPRAWPRCRWAVACAGRRGSRGSRRARRRRDGADGLECAALADGPWSRATVPGRYVPPKRYAPRGSGTSGALGPGRSRGRASAAHAGFAVGAALTVARGGRRRGTRSGAGSGRCGPTRVSACRNHAPRRRGSSCPPRCQRAAEARVTHPPHSGSHGGSSFLRRVETSEHGLVHGAPVGHSRCAARVASSSEARPTRSVHRRQPARAALGSSAPSPRDADMVARCATCQHVISTRVQL